MTNTLRKVVAGVGVAIITLLQTAVAQQSNTDKEPTKNAALEPAIREGHFGRAEGHSGIHKIMVLHIAGSSVEQLKVAAQKLHTAFKNSPIPTDVVVFYSEDKELPQFGGEVFMNGNVFKLPSGANFFDLPTLEKYAGTISTFYHKNYAPNPDK
jgi:hypothetical protein